MLRKIILICLFLIIIYGIFFTHNEQLKFTEAKEIELEITDGTKNDERTILVDKKKDELLVILEDMKLGKYFFKPMIFHDKTIIIRLYGEGIKSSRFPIYITFQIDPTKVFVG